MKNLFSAILIMCILISCRETRTTSFDLNTLSTDWVRLTERKGKLVVYNSCDLGNLIMSLSKSKDNFELLFHGGQEDEKFEIIDSYEHLDTIFITTNLKDSGRRQEFKLVWVDKLKGLSRWITTYSNGFTSNNFFVVKEKQTGFETEDQPCIECWGEECDEIKSNKELIQGLWFLDKDSLSIMKINDLDCSFYYDGSQNNTEDNYKVTITDKLPEFVSETEKAEFIILKSDTDTLQYEILGLTDSAFSLRHFPSGLILLYKRLK